jgi:hypothetical protein
MPRKKSPVTPPGIDPGSFRLVTQCFIHYATPGQTWYGACWKFSLYYLILIPRITDKLTCSSVNNFEEIFSEINAFLFSFVATQMYMGCPESDTCSHQEMSVTARLKQDTVVYGLICTPDLYYDLVKAESVATNRTTECGVNAARFCAPELVTCSSRFIVRKKLHLESLQNVLTAYVNSSRQLRER